MIDSLRVLPHRRPMSTNVVGRFCRRDGWTFTGREIRKLRIWMRFKWLERGDG